MQAKENISVFIPCLVEEVYPSIGLSLVSLLERLGFAVNYNPEVFCCGQPAFNSGCVDQAREVANKAVTQLCSGESPLVVPSGSCTAMMRVFMPGLYEGTENYESAKGLSMRALELSEFLSRPEILSRLNGELNEKIGFHNSCHSARELRISSQIAAVLGRISGLEVVDIDTGKRDTGPACCGFGGIFSVRFEQISAAMARSRLEAFADAGVKRIVSNDPGCIMQLKQHAERLGLSLRVEHLVELLADVIRPYSGAEAEARSAVVPGLDSSPSAEIQ